MVILSVPDIHCSKCIERITHALSNENILFSTNLQSKTVAINGNAETVQKAIGILDDLGFDAHAMED